MKRFANRAPKNYQWTTYLRSGSVLPTDISFVSLLAPEDWVTNVFARQHCNLKRIVGNAVFQLARDTIDANDDAWCRWFWAVMVLDQDDVVSVTPNIPDPSNETELQDETVLAQGVFSVGLRAGDSALVAGTGSINAFSQIMPSQQLVPLDIRSNRRITSDQHIVLAYGAAFSAVVDRDDEALYVHTTSARTLIQIP